MKGLGKVRAGAAIAAAGALLTLVAPAQAQRPPSLGNGAPSGQSGIQLYNFNNYLSNGAGEITCPAPPATPTPYCVNPPAPSTSAARLERVFAFLQARGIKNVELYGYPGNPFPSGGNPTRRHRRPAGPARPRQPVRPALPGPSRLLRAAGTPRSTRPGSSARTTSVRPGFRAASARPRPTSRSSTTSPSSTSAVSARSSWASDRPTSTTTSPSSPSASWTTACSRAAGRSSWSAPTRAGSSRRSTSAGPSAVPPGPPRATAPPARPYVTAMINQFRSCEPDRLLPRQGPGQSAACRAATTISARSARASSTSSRCSPPRPTA